ncbi:paired amphipathic helix protein Sin3-like 4 [Andrographis paniculata]|uniref:paired amphipathic helix protein Sin3-like 4 n=1 Tax=Andrographis paniculata TaxID=175694 RepID=UPI0021E8B952|nr:paired amphipathic helix protein Sin3-like 4 [Andrographis paniculata]XP_051121673.1 paired amphipathic helix protein Sin3-like 4 [Andrographis paniculata]
MDVQFPTTSQLKPTRPMHAGEFLGKEDGINYLQTVKEVFRGREDKFCEFIEVLRDFRAQKIPGADVVLEAKELFEGHWDLILGLNAFLPEEAQIELPHEEEIFLRKNPVEFNDAIEFVEKIKATFQDRDHDVYTASIDILDMFRKGRKSAKEVYSKISVLFGDHVEFIIDFAHFLPLLTGTASVELPQSYRNPIPYGEDKNPSNCESHHPSYQLVPGDVVISIPSQRTKIGYEVLNDNWVCVASESEDYSSKHIPKNQYEESLFKCEDDRFELDILLETAKTAASHVEKLMNDIENNKIKLDSTFCIGDHLKVKDLRCIENLYGEYGLDVLEGLKKNIKLSLPIILNRLNNKMAECEKSRAKFNKVWEKVNHKNYLKSLDHKHEDIKKT